MARIHSSPFAGSWYPGQAEELARLLDELFDRSAERTGSLPLRDPAGVVVPHAGLAYSGTVAAAAYRAIAASRPSRIILMGFSHRGGPASVAIPDVESIATPAGETAVDMATVGKLASAPPFEIVSEQRVCDHSVEIQLPLLRKAAPGVPVTPLYVGGLDADAREAASEALAALVEPGTVLIASSDLTHYGRSFYYEPFPPDSHVHERLRELDFGIIEAAGSVDADIFLDHLAATGSTVCGYEPIALLLRTLARSRGGEVFQETLDYQTSAEITGDTKHSVSYAALGYFRSQSFELTREDQAALLESAHKTLDKLLDSGEREPVPPKGGSGALEHRSGAFVSLHEGGVLRGCIGHRSGCQALSEAIPELTLSAALDDPRFRPMREAKGPVEIEISVLTPLKRLADTAGFKLGVHGVYLECGPRRALLLPQVGRAREWTPEEFLSALAREAGLPADGWARPGAALYVFQAQVFAGTARARSASLGDDGTTAL
jgi:AmmeMemoRadiSam system protein B/AmmeMemoRadiSam system protein A